MRPSIQIVTRERLQNDHMLREKVWPSSASSPTPGPATMPPPATPWAPLVVLRCASPVVSVLRLIILVPSARRGTLSAAATTHPAVATQLVAVVDALLLGEGESLPTLVEVAQAGVDLAIKDTPWMSERKKESRVEK